MVDATSTNREEVVSRKPLIALASAMLISLGTFVAPAVSGASPDPNWHVGYYTASGQTLSMAQAMAGTDGGLATVAFTSADNTALLLNQQGSSGYLGADTGMSVSATFTIAGATASDFAAYPDSCILNGTGLAPNTRLFFETSNAGGFDPAHYWWADAAWAYLGNGTYTLSATLDTNSTWSDFYGKSNQDPNYTASFLAAASNVTAIGLSFGGGCHFESGVGTLDGQGTLSLTSFSVS